LKGDSDLQDRITVAVDKKSQDILDSVSPTTSQVTWAFEAIQNLKQKALSIMNYVLAANSAASTAAIQTNVDAAVDVLISGGV
jgi:hypothetical protein